jgi:3-oxoacyl-[acyl-carrier protein] reductase
VDLADIAQVEEFAGGLAADGGVDALVNNAGANWTSEIVALDTDVWKRTLEINLTAPFILIRHLAPVMAERRWGRIVNVASVYGIVGRPGRAAYSASKAGLLALTRAAALEFGANDVLVNAVCPGFVETEMTYRNNTSEQIDRLRAQVPLDRLALADEVAEFITDLGSERNTYIHAQALPIDGGFLSQ